MPAVKLRRQGWMEASLHRIAIDSRDETSKAFGDGDSGGFTNRPRRFTHLRNCVLRQDFWKASDNILVSLVCFAIFQPASWRFSADVKECRRAQRDPCGVLFCALFITLQFYVEELMAANFLKSIFIFFLPLFFCRAIQDMPSHQQIISVFLTHQWLIDIFTQSKRKFVV